MNKKSFLTIYNKSTDTPKDVSIIIVNHKSWKHTQNCINSLNLIDNNDFTFEIIVVDNYSNDDRLKEFSEANADVVFIENSGNNGFANGCNVGAQHSKGAYLLFLNPDTLANKEAIQKMLASLQENSNYGIVSCSQINSKGNPEDTIRIFPSLTTLFGLSRAVFRLFDKEYKSIVNSREKIIFPNWVSGSTIFISRKWFDKINHWNEDYWMYFEDVDLCKRVQDLGGKVVLLKDVSIIHDHGGASRINPITAALTKSEVLISKHVYVHTHFKGVSKIASQLLLIIQNIVSKLILGILGGVLCFIPKLNVQWYLLKNMANYYVTVMAKRTLLSKRSTQFPR